MFPTYVYGCVTRCIVRYVYFCAHNHMRVSFYCVFRSLSLSLSLFFWLSLYFCYPDHTAAVVVVALQPTAPSRRCRCRAASLPTTKPCTRNRETVVTESTHPKTLKSSRGPRRGSRLGSSWLWWGGWRCGQWLRGWWGWKLRGGGCSSRSRRPLRGISLPLTHRGGGVNNSPARVPPSFRLCPALCQLMRLSPRAVVDLFPTSVLSVLAVHTRCARAHG